MSNDTYPEADSERLACQQILAEDHSVFSLQRLLIPRDVCCAVSSGELLRFYLEYVKRFTLGIIRVETGRDTLDFRLTGVGLVLIRFSVPLTEQDGTVDKTTLRICGGLLVQPKECDRGQLEFKVETASSGTRLSLQLADYCPLLLGSNRPSLLRKWLYRLTQAYIHKVVIIRFLRMVYRQLTGRKLPDKTAMIVVRKGENI